MVTFYLDTTKYKLPESFIAGDTMLVFQFIATQEMVGCNNWSFYGEANMQSDTGFVKEWFGFSFTVMHKNAPAPKLDFFVETKNGFEPFNPVKDSLICGYEYKLKVRSVDSLSLCTLHAKMGDKTLFAVGRRENEFLLTLKDSAQISFELRSREQGTSSREVVFRSTIGRPVGAQIFVPLNYTNGQDTVWFKFSDPNRFNKQSGILARATITDLDDKVIWADDASSYWQTLNDGARWIGADWLDMPVGPKIGKLIVKGVNGTVDSVVTQFYVQNPWWHDYAVAGKTIGGSLVPRNPYPDHSNFRQEIHIGVSASHSLPPSEISRQNISRIGVIFTTRPNIPFWPGYDGLTVGLEFNANPDGKFVGSLEKGSLLFAATGGRDKVGFIADLEFQRSGDYSAIFAWHTGDEDGNRDIFLDYGVRRQGRLYEEAKKVIPERNRRLMHGRGNIHFTPLVIGVQWRGKIGLLRIGAQWWTHANFGVVGDPDLDYYRFPITLLVRQGFLRHEFDFAPVWLPESNERYGVSPIQDDVRLRYSLTFMPKLFGVETIKLNVSKTFDGEVETGLSIVF